MNDEQRAVRVLLRMFHLFGVNETEFRYPVCPSLDMKRNAGHRAQKSLGFRLVLVPLACILTFPDIS